jgi:BlaI family transcriptional regulator, penicillinase repressor
VSKPPVPPSDFELQILQVLWSRGACTVREVLDSLTDGKERAYTSVLSVMQVMRKKGLLGTEKPSEGLAYHYTPLYSKKQILGPLMQGIVKKVFGGSPRTAVQQILESEKVSTEEIRELRRLLDQIEAKQKGK